MRSVFRKTIPIAIILFISGVLILGYNHAADSLKTFFSNFSEKNFNTKLYIGSIGFKVPFSLELRDIKINDSIYVPIARIYPNISSFLLKKKFVVSTVRVIDPVFKIKKGGDSEVFMPILTPKKTSGETERLSNLNFYFSRINIENASLIYDGGNDKVFEIVKIKGFIQSPDLSLPKDNNFYFKGVGFIKNRDSEFLSPFKIKGVIEKNNVVTSNLQASDIKLSLFEGFYGDHLNDIMREGRVDVVSNIYFSKNELIAKCLLEGDGLSLKKELKETLENKIAVNFVLSVNFRNRIVKFKNIQSNIFDFVFSQS